jgi:Na+-translocating ferredoxin:NAD+ oxidoreductase subunit B
MSIILIAVIVLGGIGIVSAIVLYWASKRFAIVEDERVSAIASILPQANCGGCGYPGCNGFAEACVKSADENKFDNKFCAVGGKAVMEQIGTILGLEVSDVAPKIAVVRCGGTCDLRTQNAQYDGARLCSVESMVGSGETGCSYGCLGLGDCVSVCKFNALHLNSKTGLPEVDENNCTGCGSCVSACPRSVIELRPKGPKSRRIYVNCINKDTQTISSLICKASCIGCGECTTVCKFGGITVTDNLAYINPDQCRLCRKCVDICPQNIIKAVNFPVTQGNLNKVK